MTAKKCIKNKKRVVVLVLKPIAFLMFSLLSPSSLLKLPTDNIKHPVVTADFLFYFHHDRFKFKSADVLRTLRCIIQALYKEKAGDKCLSCALLPLDTLYEMVLSHSQFLEVILDDEEAGKRDLKGR